MSYSKIQASKNPIKHAAKLYGLNDPSGTVTDVIKTKVKGGTQIKTITKDSPDNYTVKKGQTQTTNPSSYIQDLINQGITREEAEGRKLVDPSNYNLFPKSKTKETIEFIADPINQPKPEKDYSYLQGLTPTGGYARDGIMYGQKISSTVGSTLRGGKDPMTREYTKDEIDYLNKTRKIKIASMSDYYSKYPNSKLK